MKNRCIFSIALLMTVIMLFSACAGKEAEPSNISELSVLSDVAKESAVNNSVIGDMESNAESQTDVGSLTVSEPLSAEDASAVAEPLALDDKNSYVTIITETAEYSFNGEFCSGRYDTEFTGVENDEGGITLTLLDGRTMNLNYSEVIYDETDKIYRTEINGMDFMITESYNSSNELIQNFECIERPEFFKNTDIITDILITYYPERGHGRIAISYVYEVDGDALTLRYADGGVLTKTVEWDEETGSYRFAG